MYYVRFPLSLRQVEDILHEMFVKIYGEQYYLWRAIDQQGEALEAYVSTRRNKAAALTFLRKALRR